MTPEEEARIDAHVRDVCAGMIDSDEPDRAERAAQELIDAARRGIHAQPPPKKWWEFWR